MKSKKKVVFVVVFAMLMMSFCACGGSSGSKKITVDVLLETMKLTNVSYYDFGSQTLISGQSGKCTVLSNSLNSTEVWFIDADGYTRTACFDTALANKPKEVKVYTNSSKSTYDTYKCTY